MSFEVIGSLEGACPLLHRLMCLKKSLSSYHPLLTISSKCAQVVASTQDHQEFSSTVRLLHLFNLCLFILLYGKDYLYHFTIMRGTFPINVLFGELSNKITLQRLLLDHTINMLMYTRRR